MNNKFAPRNPHRWVGTQQAFTWSAGEVDSRPIAEHNDEGSSFELHRLQLWGHNAQVVLTWGTSKTQSLVLDLPAIVDVPGQFSVQGVPLDDDGAEVTCAVVQVASAGPTRLRRRVSGPLALNPLAASYVALAASVVTVDAVAVAVPALGRVELMPGASIAGGSEGFEEYVF